MFREGNSVSAYLEDVARDSPLRARVIRLAYKWINSQADRVICQSDFMLDDLVRNLTLSPDSLVRIYNPADVDRIDRLTRHSGSPYGGPGPHLVSVGRLAHQKGYDILLRAFAIVREHHPDATLTVLGEGELRGALETLVEDLELADAVELPGYLANPYPHITHADLFVSSSRYEGFSNVIVEAMACGTPVVATDCPSGNREIIDHGITGWLVRPDDPEALARGIGSALSTRAGRDRESLRLSCARRFGVQQIAREYEAELAGSRV